MTGAAWRRNGAPGFFVEWTDRLAKVRGVAYNHSIYTDGYRYKSRPLGHWADGNCDVWSAGVLWPRLLGGQALAVLRHGTLNRAGADPTWPDARYSGASLQWRTVLERVFGLTFALDHDELDPRGPGAAQRDTRLRLQFDAWFD